MANLENKFNKKILHLEMKLKWLKSTTIDSQLTNSCCPFSSQLIPLTVETRQVYYIEIMLRQFTSFQHPFRKAIAITVLSSGIPSLNTTNQYASLSIGVSDSNDLHNKKFVYVIGNS